MIYKYEELTEKIAYKDLQKKYKEQKNKVIHWGQLKLFATELYFLSKFYKKGSKYLVLYVGAAPGTHTSQLARMFPDWQFDLWDPSKFKIDSLPNITLFNKFFTDKDAYNYSTFGNNILFLSDIRNLDIARAKRNNNIKLMDKIILNDITKQREWVQQIKPKRAYLKFRLPYSPGFTEYLTGPIYLQPFGPLSTEARIMVKDFINLTKYDNIVYDEKMAYFNCCIRSKQFTKWQDIINELHLENNWDITLFIYILDFYLKKTNNKTDIKTYLINILNFFKQISEKKYNTLFKK